MPVDWSQFVLLAQGESPFWANPLVPLMLIGVLFYFMMIRPESRKRNEMRKMLGDLKKNDRIVTIGGIYGTVVTSSQDSDEVTIRVDENSNARLRILRSAIARVISDDSSAAKKEKETVKKDT